MKLAEAMEKVLPPEQIEEFAGEVNGIRPMNDPDYPKEEKYDYPVRNEIQQLKDNLPPDQRTEENLALLDEINEDTREVSKKYFKYIQKVGKDSIPFDRKTPLTGMEHYADHVMYGYTDMYFKNEGKRFAKDLEKAKDKSRNGLYDVVYDSAKITKKNAPEFMNRLPELEQMESGISDATVADIESVMDDMKKIGPDDLGLAGFRSQKYNNAPRAESGEKGYALTAVKEAKLALRRAVKTGSMEEIRKAHEKYKTIKEITDHMMETARTKPEKGQSEVFEGNMDALRDETTPIPDEYLQDFAGHSKLAGLMTLYNYSEVLGIPMKDILKKPVATSLKAADIFVAQNGINSGKTAGAKLVDALSPDKAEGMVSGFQNNTGGVIMRGLESMAGFAHSKEEAQRLAGQAMLAQCATYGVVEAKKAIWRNLADAGLDKHQRLYERVLLTPEDQLDMTDLAEKFNKKNWKSELSTEKLLRETVGKGGYDYEALIQKAKKIKADAEDQVDTLDTPADSNYRNEAMDYATVVTFRKVLEAAPQQDRNSPGYLKLQAEVERRAVELEPKEAEDDLNRQIWILTGEEAGLPVNQENPAAYRKMMRSLHDLQTKKRLLRGETDGISPEERERLSNIPLDEAIRTARTDTVAYSRKVEESGRKAGVQYQSGADLAINALDKMAKEDLDAQIAILAREKTGLFVSKENSAEHQQMMRSLQDLQAKRRLLRGDTSGISQADQERLKKISLDQAIRTARNDTMAYSRKVEEDGKKTSFKYASGANRANAAIHTVEALDRMADAAGGRTRAQKIEDKIQRDAMDNRTDAQVIEDYAARSLYLNFIKNNPEKFTPEMQEVVLSNDKLQEAVNIFKKDPAFRKMVKTLGPSKLADQVINGPDSVLTSYLDATKALNDQAIGKSGSEMTQEERQEFMKNATFGENRKPGGPEA